MRKIVLFNVISLLIVLATAFNTFAGRSISLPFNEDFDTNNYSDLVWVSGGATHTWTEDGCWSGGCAKLTPPTSCAVSGRAALGDFTDFSSDQLNIRLLVKFGPTWASTASSCAGEGFGDKFMDAFQSDNRRMLVGWLRDTRISGVDNYPFGLCISSSDTLYNCDSAGGGIPPCDYWSPSGKYTTGGCGYDRFHVGGGHSTDYKNQWISIEVELTRNNYNRIYIYTQRGEFAGEYVRTAGTSSDNPWNYLRYIGGYYNQDHPTADADTYMMFDELVISSSYIGPPAGFNLTPPQNFRLIQE